MKLLQEKKDLNEVRKLDAKIMECNTEISKLEFELDELAKKLSTSNKQSDLRSKVLFWKNQLNLRRQNYPRFLQLSTVAILMS